MVLMERSGYGLKVTVEFEVSVLCTNTQSRKRGAAPGSVVSQRNEANIIMTRNPKT
jgi:hypothetical protein